MPNLYRILIEMDINFSSDDGNDGGHVYAVDGEAMPRQLTPKKMMMMTQLAVVFCSKIKNKIIK